MKKFLILFLTMAFAQSVFAVEYQHIEKTLGECQMTNMNVLKSKRYPLGTTATNETIRFTLNEDIGGMPGKLPFRHEIYLYFVGPNKYGCPTWGCRSSTIAQMNYKNNSSDELINTTFINSNSAEKIDILFKVDSSDWSRLTYNFKDGVGNYEERLKINVFGGFFVKNAVNDHIVREIRNCTFSGPINLDPRQ